MSEKINVKQPRILFLIDSISSGGAEFSTLLIAKHLVEQSLEISIVTLDGSKQPFDLAAFGLEPSILYSKVNEAAGFRNKFRQLNKFLRSWKPNIIHSTLHKSGTYGRLLKLVNPQVKHLHSYVTTPFTQERLKNENVKNWKINLIKVADRISNPLVDHFHANSNAVRVHVQHHLAIPDKKISMVYRSRKPNSYVANLEIRRLIRSELGIGDNEYLFVNTGRQVIQKAQEILLGAFGSIAKDFTQVHLAIVGRFDEQTEILKKIINKFGIQSQTHLLGFRTDVQQILVAADGFVFPSRHEGMPGALIEAYAAALPAIGSNIAPIMEILVDGKNGLVVPVNNEEKLAEAMVNFIGNKASWAEIGKSNHEFFLKNFNDQFIHNQYLQMYQRLVN